MTREEIFKACNFDLVKAKEVDQWLNSEPDQITCNISSETTNQGCEPEVYLKLKNGSRIFSPEVLKDQEIEFDQVDCIVVRTLGNRRVGIVPKYRECQLLAGGKVQDWEDERVLREVDALNVTLEQAQKITQNLFDLGSEAAKYVRSVRENAFIPDLYTLVKIEHLVDQINAFASKISGADILNRDSNAWSSVRSSTSYSWSFLGYNGCVNHNDLYYSFVAVPCLLF